MDTGLNKYTVYIQPDYWVEVYAEYADALDDGKAVSFYIGNEVVASFVFWKGGGWYKMSGGNEE